MKLNKEVPREQIEAMRKELHEKGHVSFQRGQVFAFAWLDLRGQPQSWIWGVN